MTMMKVHKGVGGRLRASTVSAEGSGSLGKMTGASVARAPNGTTKLACSLYIQLTYLTTDRSVSTEHPFYHGLYYN